MQQAISPAIVLCLIILAAAIVPPLAGATSEPTQQVVENQLDTSGTVDVIIIFENETARDQFTTEEALTITGGDEIQLLPVLYATTTTETIPALKAQPSVETVRVNQQIRRPDPTPNSSQTATTNAASEPSTGTAQVTPWGVERIEAQTAANRVTHSAKQNTTIAVVDSGIDYDHPDLGDSVVWGANFTQGTEQYGRQTATDQHGHGTAVAGIIAAQDNDRGVVGVAPGTRLYSIKVLGDENTGTLQSLLYGLDAAVKGPDGTIGTADDADIIQTSVGTGSDHNQLEAVVTAASEHALIVSSAGNAGPATDSVTYPANYPETIAVAATDKSDTTTTYSSEGEAVDVAAPGDHIETLRLGEGTTKFSGTSAAAPHVSGTIALLLAKDLEDGTRDFSNQLLRDRVQQTALDIDANGVDLTSGYGRIRTNTTLPNETQLALTANRTTVPIGGTAAFSVTDTETGDPVSAALLTNGSLVYTGPNGSATLRFIEQKNYTITASHPDTVQEIYKPTSTSVSVTSPTVSITPKIQKTQTNANVAYNMSTKSHNNIQSYEIYVRIENSSTAVITNITPNNISTNETHTTVEYSNDNASASIEAHDLNQSTGSLATVTLKAVSPGTTTLSLDDVVLTDTKYTYTFDPDSSGTITVTAELGPVVVNNTPAQDLDNDGIYEDVNGDGEFNIVDVNAYFQNYRRASIQDNLTQFDINGDGQISVVDVNRLLRIR